MSALAAAKNALENIKKLRMNNGPVKDPLKELNVRSTPSTDKRTSSSFSKSAKVCILYIPVLRSGCQLPCYVYIRHAEIS